MTLAEIIRAQLATGRPLRVTRALLEALEEPLESLLEEDVREHLPEYVLDDGTGDEANERERIEYAGAEIVRLRRERDEACAEIERLRAERDVMRRERDEALARLHDAHNTIGRLDRARGGDGSAASIREAEERARANEWLAQKRDAERARDEARVEVERLRAERDEASESLRLSVAAWDATGMQGRDAVSVIREAEERGARWALATFFGPESSALVDRSREAARICEAARKAGEHG